MQVENGTAPVRLGTRSLWSFFEGRIDDLRFYNRALTDDEILDLYNEANELPASITQGKSFARFQDAQNRQQHNFGIKYRFDTKGRTVATPKKSIMHFIKAGAR